MLPSLLPLVQTFAAACDKTRFLGLVPWDYYLDVKSVSIPDPSGKMLSICKVTNFDPIPDPSGAKDAAGHVIMTQVHLLGLHSPILLIALAVLDDLIRIAALVAVGYVIYGGIQYITSQGSPDSTKRAQQTIINALIGVAVAIIASAMVAFIGNRLGGLSK